MFEHLKGRQRVVAFAAFAGVMGTVLGVMAVFFFVYFRAFGNISNVTIASAKTAFSQITPDMYPVGLGIFGASLLICGVGAVALASIKPSNTHGAAKLATEPQMVREKYAKIITKKTPQDAEIIWGKFGHPKKKNATFVKTSEFPHGFLAAPTGAGKGVGFVIPNMLHFNGSIVCLDVKGENFEKTARYRKSIGDRIIKFSPLDPDSSHCYNPLSEIEALPDADRQYVELGKLASYFISSESPNLQSWISGGRRIFAATAMLALQRGDATIGIVKEMLDGVTPDIMAEYATEMKHHSARQEFISRSAMEPKQLDIYINVMNDSGLGTWNNPFVQRTTSRSDFSFSDLRTNPTTIYLVCPEDDIALVAPLIRLFFQQLSGVLHKTNPGEDEVFNVLFMLDEFDKLGKMDTIIEAYKTIRSYGGRIVVITQSVSQLFEIYGRDAVKGFIASAGMRMFSATSDLEAAQLISDIIGDKTYKSKSKSKNAGSGLSFAGGGSTSLKDEALRLVKVQDITNLDEDKFIIIRNPKDAVIVDKIKYYKDAYFATLYESQKGPLPLPKVSAPKSVTHAEPLPITISAEQQEQQQGKEEEIQMENDLKNATRLLVEIDREDISDMMESDEIKAVTERKSKRRKFK